MTTTASGSTRPANVHLGPGATQNWSDLARDPAGSSVVHRDLLEQIVRAEHRVAVVGPHSLDLIAGLAAKVAHLTVVTRSIPDAVTIGTCLIDHDGVDVQCADVATLTDRPTPYDVVIALDDLARVWSLESEPMTWRQVYDGVRRLVAPGGTLVLGVENELGLHRITSLRSRYTSNADEDWAVTSTFDASRPRTERALAEVAADLGPVQVLGVLPTWQEQSVLLAHPDRLGPRLSTLLGALTLGSPAFRRPGADPTRVTRAAVLSGRLPELCSGWVVVAGQALDRFAEPVLVAGDGSGRAARYVERDGHAVRQVDGERDAAVPVGADSELLSGIALDLCAARDRSGLRDLLSRYRAWLTDQAQDGVLPAAAAGTRLDNVVCDSGGDFQCLAPGHADRPLDEATWAALRDLVRIIRGRGALHPWPSSTDDATMLASLGAMVGLPPDGAPVTTGAGTEPELPAHDVAGLLALVERLTETNEALASRSRWFEERLDVREREMRTRAERHRKELELAVKQQRILQDAAEDLRRSITYRAGAAIINPIRKLGGNLRS